MFKSYVHIIIRSRSDYICRWPNLGNPRGDISMKVDGDKSWNTCNLCTKYTLQVRTWYKLITLLRSAVNHLQVRTPTSDGKPAPHHTQHQQCCCTVGMRTHMYTNEWDILHFIPMPFYCTHRQQLYVCVCVCFLSPTQQHLEAAEVATVCGCKATKHSEHNLYMDFKNRNVTFTVLPLAPLPCRMHGSIVATAPCLFIPDAAAAILGRQRREQAGVRGWTPDNFRFRLFSEQLSGVA